MKKKLIAYLISSAMLFTTAFCGLAVPVHATESGSQELPEIMENDYTFVKDSKTGHIAVEEEYIPYKSESSSDKIKPNAALPSSYGSFTEMKTKYPSTRNQNPYGTCWAFAATACAEFDMVKNHGYSVGAADLSELQLAYFNYNTPYTVPGLDGDNVWIPSNAGKSYLDMGGNLIYSMHTLAQWKSYAYENNLPYANVVKNENYIPNKSIALYHNAAQLRNVRYLDIKNDPASVKRAIMDYGAVYISYHHDSDYYSLNKYSLYYNPYDSDTNHDVVIVGWSDSIPASQWPAGKRPASSGAWLVRNSWSTDMSVGSEDTYFYMSYQDKSLANTAYVLDFEPGNNNDNLYQHDGSTTHVSTYTDSVANVFSVPSSIDSASQRLDSVMIPFSSETDVNYKVEIYTGLTSTKPTSGYLNTSATTTGWTSSRGIYTIDLKNPVYLYPGEKFAIVVTSLNGYQSFDIEASRNVTYSENGVSKPWFSTTAYIGTGESYIHNGSSYVDAYYYNDSYSLSSYETGNICLKGVTSDNSTKKYKVIYNLNGGTNSKKNPNGFISSSSGTYSLYNPTRSGYHFCGWYTDANFTNKATYINYNNKADQSFYAKWCSNSNPSVNQITKYANKDTSGSYRVICNNCGLVKATYTVPAISKIKLNYTKMTYTGKNRNAVPVITSTNGKKLVKGTDYTFTYNKDSRKSVGRYCVTVKFKGKYNESSKKLYYSVVPKAPATASAKLTGYNDIKVSWSKSTGASGYYVYYKKSTASNYSKYKLTTKRSVKFTDMSGNTKYNFKIVPYFKSGSTKYKSNKSKIVSTTTLKKLNQPTIKKAGDGRVSLNWQSISAASGYQVYWASKKSGKYSKLCDYSNAYIGVTFTSPKGKTYWYKTRAYKTVDGKRIYGPWSTPKSFTLK